MDSDRERWDNLHAQSTKRGDASAFLQIIFREFAALLKPGKALDIACGTGRNAIFLAIPFALAGAWTAYLLTVLVYAAFSFFVVQRVRHHASS